MEENTITLLLSASQRNLILQYEPFFADEDLFKLISIAIKKGKEYEINLTMDQYEELIDEISELANHEEDEKKQDKLDDLCDYLEELYDDSEEDGDVGGDEGVSINAGAVCILKVALVDDKKIWRTIAIREGQTLHDLHNAIFDAFDRDEEHMYSFFFPTKSVKFNPRKIYEISEQYTHPFMHEDNLMDDEESEDASMTPIASLELLIGEVFYYLFDFGDEWWHEISVEAIEEKADTDNYPRILKKQGESPDQYPDSEDDDDE